jgi:hypothetical protein
MLPTEALKAGVGGLSRVSRLSGADRKTVRKGVVELPHPPLTGRVRRVGGGRKKLTEVDGTLVEALEALVEPQGAPMSLTRWTTKSLANLVSALPKKHPGIKKSALAKVLASRGFSLKANKKNSEGVSHPDRDLQFRHMATPCATFEKNGHPLSSGECQKKELMGNFKNHGREGQSKGKDTVVNVSDFHSLADGKAAPDGVYDVVKNRGLVKVGGDHDTASVAVESIRRWGNAVGKTLYEGARDLLITSAGGGSNGVRTRLGKKALQRLSTETPLSITVTHLPPATSKWNKSEHRLFSYISLNWRARPLISWETIIELRSSTTTKQGLTVRAVVDKKSYPTGVKVPDAEMNLLNITRNTFHGDWNYTIKPQNA